MSKKDEKKKKKGAAEGPVRVKCFVESVQLMKTSSSAHGDLMKIEEAINEWLEGRPAVELVDVKLSTHAAPVADKLTLYVAMAMVLYREREAGE